MRLPCSTRSTPTSNHLLKNTICPSHPPLAGNPFWCNHGDGERVSEEVARVVFLLDLDQFADVVPVEGGEWVDRDVGIHISGITGVSAKRVRSAGFLEIP
jgi:hypothetical protein